jgi:dihydropteroate synthase
VKRYLRPLGFLCGDAARQAVAAGSAVMLAGGSQAFSFLEFIERGDFGVRRRIVPVSDSDFAPGSDIDLTLARIRSGPGGSAALPEVMGIINATPDSFSEGGSILDPEQAIRRGRAMIEAGAGILDIGGESTRPGSEPVDPDEEQLRVLPVLSALRPDAATAHVRISVDTRNAATMRVAIAAGATMINDVSALSHDHEAMSVIARTGVEIVLMHMRGDPRTMQDAPRYDDVALDVHDYLEARIAACVEAGIPRSRIVADPGIGFGKTIDHNLALLSQLALFHGLGVRLLVGASRKGFIARLSRDEPPRERLPGSLAVALAAAGQGAQILRVHDVPETIQALRVAAALARA